MGTVNFNTNVQKTVDLNKNVFLDVNKDVFSFANVQGNLATAEASADAVGGGGDTTTGEREKIPFIPDDLSAPQIVTANPQIANPNSNTILVPSSDTDFEKAVERTLFTQVLSDSGQNDLAVQIVTPGKVAFDQGDNTSGNAYADWQIDGGEDPFPLDNNDGIVADFSENFDPDAADPLADVCYTYTFSDIDFDPGIESGQTARVSFIVYDTDGNYAAQTVVFVAGDDGSGFEDLELDGAFAGLIQPGLANSLTPPGTVLDTTPSGARVVAAGTFTDVDGNGNSVDFDKLAGFQLLIEDNPEVAIGENADLDFPLNPAIGDDGLSSSDLVGVNEIPGVVENPSDFGTDASATFIWTTCREVFQPGEGNLAETDTFAQVSPDGAFSFSESLAASNSTDFFDFDLG